MNKNYKFIRNSIFLSLALFVGSCATIPQIPKINSIHTALGVPLDNTPNDEYYIVRPQYVLSYNHTKGVANWVSWNLNKDWYGKAPRMTGNFLKDTLIPASMFSPEHHHYTNSGFDRGHLVRSAERTRTVEDNLSTFFMTNILPQTPDLNRGVWLNFERYCEQLCKEQNKELYIIAGGVYKSKKTIKNEGLIAEPDSCYKIVVILERGQGKANINQNTQVVAVMMPNKQGVRNEKWENYKTTVRNIEKQTGYDFLNLIPQSIQNVIENK